MYKIKLPNFEGPFDLLLYFIKRDELNIYDIPISKITEEFLSYIRLIKYFDLELAGEFILMAATLMYIKAQLLLPATKDDNEEEIEDPRTGLVQKLLEYKKFKEAAADLKVMAENQKYVYYRHLFDADRALIENTAPYRNATLFDLLNAFKKAVERNSKNNFNHEVKILNVTIEEKSSMILEQLSKMKRINFSDITMALTRIHIVVTFLAILELMRSRKIYIFQDENFDEIIITEPQTNNSEEI